MRTSGRATGLWAWSRIGSLSILDLPEPAPFNFPTKCADSGRRPEGQTCLVEREASAKAGAGAYLHVLSPARVLLLFLQKRTEH